MLQNQGKGTQGLDQAGRAPSLPPTQTVGSGAEQGEHMEGGGLGKEKRGCSFWVGMRGRVQVPLVAPDKPVWLPRLGYEGRKPVRLQSDLPCSSQYLSSCQSSLGHWESRGKPGPSTPPPFGVRVLPPMTPFVLLKRFCQTHPPQGAGASSEEGVCFLWGKRRLLFRELPLLACMPWVISGAAQGLPAR